MKVKEMIRAKEQNSGALRAIGCATVATGFATLIYLAVWSPAVAGAPQGERNLPQVELGDASLAGGSERDDRAEKANLLARDQGEWLRAAHSKAALTAEDQPLPSQF